MKRCYKLVSLIMPLICNVLDTKHVLDILVCRLCILFTALHYISQQIRLFDISDAENRPCLYIKNKQISYSDVEISTCRM